MSHGVDVSNNNNPSSVDWDGVEFCFIKATESTNFTDRLFTKYRSICQARGILWAPYHFAHPDQNSARAEASFFLASWFHGPTDRPPVAPALDIETRQKSGGGTISPLAIMGSVPLAAWIDEFNERVAGVVGLDSFFYSFRSYASSLCPKISRRWPLWLATASGKPGSYKAFAGRVVAIEQWGQTNIDQNESYVPIASGSTETGDEDNMLNLIKGDASNEWWITDFVWKRYCATPGEADVLGFHYATHGGKFVTDNGNPFVYPQAYVDAIPRCDVSGSGGDAPTHFKGVVDINAVP